MSQFLTTHPHGDELEDSETRHHMLVGPRRWAKLGKSRCLCSFLQYYNQVSWEREARPLSRWPYPYFDKAFFRHRTPATIQFIFRYASIFDQDSYQRDALADTKANDDWRPVNVGHIPNLNKRFIQEAAIEERRHLLSMNLFIGSRPEGPGAGDTFRFTMISLGALRGNILHESMVGVSHEEAQQVEGLAPLLLFIVYLRHLMTAWSGMWMEILARISAELSLSASIPG